MWNLRVLILFIRNNQTAVGNHGSFYMGLVYIIYVPVWEGWTAMPPIPDAYCMLCS